MNASAVQAPPILHLSQIVGSPLIDDDGGRPLGKVKDVIVRLGGAGYPPITGFLVEVAGREAFLPAELVARLSADGVVLRKAKLDLRHFERRPEEVLLRRDVLDRQLINVEGARLVRANEIELALINGAWRVVGVDTGPRGGLRRLLPRPLGQRIGPGEFLDWAGVEPFVGHVPTVRLRVPHPTLAKLHPAQIADLVEAASRREGEEIIQAVGEGDRELEADVFEELDDQHQKEFLEDRPDEQVADVGSDGVLLRKAKLDLRPFERRPDEVLLKRDVLDRQLINVEGARLVRANEIELALVAGSWRVVGVDTGARGGLRRLLPRQLGHRIATGAFLDWASVEPFVGHVPTVRLRIPHPKLAKLHPAKIADLVEAASRQEGEEIIQAVGLGDRELEADVFEELDDQHQKEFLEDRPDDQVAEIVARMAADDAADALDELDDDKRERVLARLPASHRTKVRALLGYDPAEAGGLMSPDFVAVNGTTPVSQALDAVRRSSVPPEQLTVVFAVDPAGELRGAVPLAALIRADPSQRINDLVRHDTPSLSPDASFEEVARTMADFNLTCVPVVNEDRRIIGAVTVDDVLEAMLPRSWRRRFGLLGEDKAEPAE